MGKLVCNAATLTCSFGVAPGTLMVAPTTQTMASNQPAATIMDYAPFANILPFGMCTSPSNPAVIAAFGAPAPCLPVTVAPWTPGSPTVLIGGNPALDDSSQCMCAWAGVITVAYAGQATTDVT